MSAEDSEYRRFELNIRLGVFLKPLDPKLAPELLLSGLDERLELSV